MVLDLKKEQFVPVLIILMFFWALMHPFSKMIVSDVSPALIAFLRNAIGAVVILGMIYFSKTKLTIDKKDIVPLVVLGIIGTALSSLLLFNGIGLSTATNASILVNINPIFIAVLAPLIIHEKLDKKQIIGVVIAFLGMVLVTTNGMNLNQMINDGYFIGNVILIGSAVCITIYTIYGKKYVEKYGGIVATFYTVLAGAAFLLFYTSASGEIGNIAKITIDEWPIILYIGAVITGFIYVIWYKSIPFIGASRASSFKLLIPVFAVIASIILLGEVPSIFTIVGGAMVVAGLALNQKLL
ncbi:DMT family transporter [Candidatus Micrarchaeota archaeon]|nr:DMT family transporter [Candidatus Micrarchaeota archaeon]MBU1166775.1 DMT family transporter [Candidatus Micrarchaeota archaeon]MBU1887227.1 DMT family transporter [Candidatus Micrarchaeota archaeon]